MFNFDDVKLENIVVHNVGNKLREEELLLSGGNLDLGEDVVMKLSSMKRLLVPIHNPEVKRTNGKNQMWKNIGLFMSVNGRLMILKQSPRKLNANKRNETPQTVRY